AAGDVHRARVLDDETAGDELRRRAGAGLGERAARLVDERARARAAVEVALAGRVPRGRVLGPAAVVDVEDAAVGVLDRALVAEHRAVETARAGPAGQAHGPVVGERPAGHVSARPLQRARRADRAAGGEHRRAAHDERLRA